MTVANGSSLICHLTGICFLTLCGCAHQKHYAAQENQQIVSSVEYASIVETVLNELFFPPKGARSGVIHVFSDVLDETDKIEISGMSVFLRPKGELNPDEQNLKLDGFWISIYSISISEYKALIHFAAKSEDDHEWFRGGATLTRSYMGWSIVSFGGAM